MPAKPKPKAKAKTKAKTKPGMHPNSLAALKKHQFKPGESGNPSGNPIRLETKLSHAIANMLAEVEDGKRETWAMRLARGTVRWAVNQLEDGEMPPHVIAILKEFGDRTEGRARQPIDFKDSTEEFSGRTAAQLDFYAVFGEWPNEQQIAFYQAEGRWPAPHEMGNA